MCFNSQDSNKSVRQQAKIAQARSDYEAGQKQNKFNNLETHWVKRKAEIGRGSSIKISDNYSNALYATGQGRQMDANYKIQKQQLFRVSGKTGESRSSKYGFSKYKEILDKQNAIQRSIDNTWGRQMAQKDQQVIAAHRRYTSKNRQMLGEIPAAGFPVMMLSLIHI